MSSSHIEAAGDGPVDGARRLSRSPSPERHPNSAGETINQRGDEQGERGECFYIVESGRAEVLQDGRLLRRSGAATAVTGYPASSTAGEEVVTARLNADAERRPAASDAD